MVTYSFDHLANVTLTEHLYRMIRKDIVSGVLKAGERLPSKRACARQNSISTITVENAYAQLVTEGYLISRPRSGYYVADLGEYGVEVPQGEREQRSGSVVTGRETALDVDVCRYDTTEASIDRKHIDKNRSIDWFADFAGNQTSPDNFPFTIWARLSRRILSDRQQDLLQNPPSGGVPELREAIAQYLQQFRGIHAKAEQVIVGAGTEYLYGLLIQLLGMKRIYASENPGYQKVVQVYDSFGVEHVEIPLDHKGLSVEKLKESPAQVVHVTPSHHYPTGITMPASRRNELLAWAGEQPGRYLIEDDYDSEFRLTGKPLPSLLEQDRNDRVIYMNTFSKSLSSTIRVSYMVLPMELLKQYEESMGFYSCTVPTFEQYTLAAFLREGYFEKHINRMRNMSRRKRNALLTAIEESPLAKIAKVSEENAGLHFLLRLEPDHLGQRAFVNKLAREHQVRLKPLREDVEDFTFIVNYSSVPQDHLQEAVGRICACLGLADE